MTQASSANLGRSIAVHRGKFSAGGWFWYIGGLLVVAGIYGPIHALVAPSAQEAKAGLGSAFMTGGIALVIGLVVLIVPLMRWRQQVELFEHGFVWKKLLGTDTVARDQVRNLKSTRHITRMGTYVEVEVTLTSGRELSISGVEEPEQLANIIGSYARPLAQPAAAAPGWAPPAATGWRPPGT
ncbi:MAG: hypothetical protein QM756_08785 [Polyangiaceae bacterium]